MKLSVVIPAYNEAGTILGVIDAVAASGFQTQIIVVDDASTDGTAARLQPLADAGRIALVRHAHNRGKGAAVRSGFEAATGDVLIVQDADLEYNPADFAKLVAPIAAGDADAVFGSRFVGGESHRVLYYWHALANRFLTTLSNMFTNLNMTDMECGYKAFKREMIAGIRLEENGFGFEPEIVAKVAALKCRIYEVGVSYRGRTYAEGKKIRWTDGLRALVCIVKYNV